MRLGGMVLEVPEELEGIVGFLWVMVIANLCDIIRKKKN